jgi:tetratricopeptide (TPR) repeat protein
VTQHLVMGVRLAALESDNGQSAIRAYKNALDVNKTDLDALEMMARQQFASGFEVEAISYLDRLADAALNANDPFRHARALRYQAEILHASENRPDWDRARASLVSLIRSLESSHAIDLNKKLVELALAHELLCVVQTTREKFTATRAELNSAAQLFQRIHTKDGAEGLARLRHLADDLSEAEKDRDNPDVAD